MPFCARDEGDGRGAQKPQAQVADEASSAKQRQYYRAPVDFAVAAMRADDDTIVASRAHDLSGAGIRLSMDQDLNKGQVLELQFRLPTGAPELRPSASSCSLVLWKEVPAGTTTA